MLGRLLCAIGLHKWGSVCKFYSTGVVEYYVSCKKCKKTKIVDRRPR